MTFNHSNWTIKETSFNIDHLAKFESIFAQGNGRIGLRNALEEAYVTETRGMFVAGTFNKAFTNEVTELPNFMDVTRFDIYVDGELFSLLHGTVHEYERILSLKHGEVIRHVTWESPKGTTLKLTFRRFVSSSERDLIAQRINIQSLSEKPLQLKIKTGIDGTMHNHGSQHFTEESKRVYDESFLQYGGTTSQSNVYVSANVACRAHLNGEEFDKRFSFARREIMFTYDVSLEKKATFVVEKMSIIHSTRDGENQDVSTETIDHNAYQRIKMVYDEGYDEWLKKNNQTWDMFWGKNDIRIESEDPFDVIAVRFAIYHMNIMTPKHDSRMSIAAKGLTGEGYKGHTFWDKDIFILPFWIYHQPEVAKSLVEYRYQSLLGAKKKATENGYEGAMYPWESAWINDGEVTPEEGGTDIYTGKPERIITGKKEIHITADVIYGLWHYWKMTGDDAFMHQKGYEMVFETARFWLSRLEYNPENDFYEINDIIGPDEYKEHVNNNHYTNYMAKWNIELAIRNYEILKETLPNVYEQLSDRFSLEHMIEEAKEKVKKIFLQEPREDNIIAQDDTYLSLKEIDLHPYKNLDRAGAIMDDYNITQISKLKVSKQADVVVLPFLFKDLFDEETLKANVDYYEAHTLHDSSLSLSTYAIMSKEIGKLQQSYSLFKQACRIDLGPQPHSSDMGIHAASLGGIWEVAIMGYAGVRQKDGRLNIDPVLPEQWNRISFAIWFRNQRIYFDITKTKLSIKTEQKIDLIVQAEPVIVQGKMDFDI